MLAGLIALGCRPTAYGFTSHSPTLRRGSHRCPPLVDLTIIPVAKNDLLELLCAAVFCCWSRWSCPTPWVLRTAPP